MLNGTYERYCIIVQSFAIAEHTLSNKRHHDSCFICPRVPARRGPVVRFCAGKKWALQRGHSTTADLMEQMGIRQKQRWADVRVIQEFSLLGASSKICCVKLHKVWSTPASLLEVSKVSCSVTVSS